MWWVTQYLHSCIQFSRYEHGGGSFPENWLRAKYHETVLRLFCKVPREERGR